MPKKRLPPRLWLRAESQRDGSQKTWVIVDGERYVRTGCAEDATAEAQQRLGEYIAAKWAPPKTGDAAKITVADVLLVYLEEKVPETASPRDNQHIVARLNDWWGEYTVADIRRKLCIDYTASRETHVQRPQGPGVPAGGRQLLQGARISSTTCRCSRCRTRASRARST